MLGNAVLICCVLLAALLVHACDLQQEPPSFGTYGKAAVATDAGPCSVVGKDILKRGGSVVDAGIAAMLCIGLYNAHSTGIGGGGFMVMYDAESGETLSINSREVAPLAARPNMYEGKLDGPYEGADWIGVPGQIAGFWEAHQRFGKLPWKDVFEHSIKMAKDGFKIGKALAGAIQYQKESIVHPEYNLMPILAHANGTLKKEGDEIRFPQMATTLEIIAEEGVSAFYDGTLTEKIIEDLDAAAGHSFITKEDLLYYKPKVGPPINITLGDLTVLTPGAPSGGPLVCYILNILKGYKFNHQNMKDVESRVLTYHRIVEAFKFSFAKRNGVVDPKFDGRVDDLVKKMTSDAYAEETRSKIVDSSTQPEEYYDPFSLDIKQDSGTSHLSIIGEDGSAFSMTTSINRFFGSQVRGLQTGIIFNEHMEVFKLDDSKDTGGLNSANFIRPGKTPYTSMSPAIVVNTTGHKPSVKMVVGASGASKIISAVSLVIMDTLWFRNRLDTAVLKKRLTLSPRVPDAVHFELGFEEAVIKGLERKGHLIAGAPEIPSVVQAVLRRADGKLDAKSDDRKGGYPDGY